MISKRCHIDYPLPLLLLSMSEDNARERVLLSIVARADAITSSSIFGVMSDDGCFCNDDLCSLVLRLLSQKNVDIMLSLSPSHHLLLPARGASVCRGSDTALIRRDGR